MLLHVKYCLIKPSSFPQNINSVKIGLIEKSGKKPFNYIFVS
jgi:hypothetical protein